MQIVFSPLLNLTCFKQFLDVFCFNNYILIPNLKLLPKIQAGDAGVKKRPEKESVWAINNIYLNINEPAFFCARKIKVTQ